MPLSSVPSGADTSRCLNWVIRPPICFIAHEGDSAGLGESYFCGKEGRLLMPSQCFLSAEEGALAWVEVPLARPHPPYSNLTTSWPKSVHFHPSAEVVELFFFFFF